MPHLVILYTPQLETETDMGALCRKLCDAALTLRDEQDRQVFPTGGTRVLAFPAAHHAVADGKADYAFCYMNLRIAAGRSEAVKQRAGELLLAAAREQLGPLMEQRLLGVTVQVDEAPGQVYDGKFSNLHPLFAR